MAESVTDSCGCVFCDLMVAREELTPGVWIHAHRLGYFAMSYCTLGDPPPVAQEE